MSRSSTYLVSVQLDLLRYWQNPLRTSTSSIYCRNSLKGSDYLYFTALISELTVFTQPQTDCAGVRVVSKFPRDVARGCATRHQHRADRSQDVLHRGILLLGEFRMHINTSVLRSTYSPGMHIKRVQTPGVGTRLPSQTCAKTVGSGPSGHVKVCRSFFSFCEMTSVMSSFFSVQEDMRAEWH